ncbi:2-dehydro-3-deoxygluconokinase [Phaeobacter sp. CECT 5382]|uniref:carbohydrate kinase family protein n=1 Tax=Phaeobacter sp. CECT 5382 TaxID=1712645 RepID=UPI0006D977D8|nr:carbohydrate kinase [Phaeobacter sp. CECT 5382]CUH89768.1 2-dehydro-3-deoxygluconokinase [Phaeobacter sp. CECT 5382]
MILCCGEALIDMIHSAPVSGPETYVPRPGGAVLNTAVALGRLGASAAMLTGLSRDPFGKKLADHLTASHVNVSQIVWSDRPTTLAFVQLLDGQASYFFFDENSAGRMLNTADIPKLPQEVSALFMGGISLACEPAADSYMALLEREGRARVVMIDPNIRPGFIQNTDRYRRRLSQMMKQANIVKVSEEDLNWIFPGPEEFEQKVKNILKMGASIVVLTRGENGATGFLAGGTQIYVPSTRVEIVDTVGAGDTFNAGFLAKLSELGCLSKDQLKSLTLDTLQQALEYGTRAASVTVSRIGADPPWAREL